MLISKVKRCCWEASWAIGGNEQEEEFSGKRQRRQNSRADRPKESWLAGSSKGVAEPWLLHLPSPPRPFHGTLAPHGTWSLGAERTLD